MPVVQLTSSDEYENFIKSDNLSIIHFYAPWADQCTQINEALEQMSKLDENKTVRFGKVIAESFPEISIKCNIIAVPTTLLFKNKTIVARIDGADMIELREQINKQLLTRNNHDSLQDRLQRLISQAPCMLFMKGSPEAPRCGFSRQIIELLEQHNAAYETFDILEDNDVREGLKKFSNWPTYPQLYIRGKLAGGLDVVKEMNEEGELGDMLPKKHGTDNLEDRLKNLINEAPCMLFMKGTRETPRCGFSRQVIELLDEHKGNYQTFDILEDNEVREGLKKFSNWPTYPQLYINGELIGGLDIIKELCDSGDLDDMLPKKGT